MRLLLLAIALATTLLTGCVYRRAIRLEDAVRQSVIEAHKMRASGLPVPDSVTVEFLCQVAFEKPDNKPILLVPVGTTIPIPTSARVVMEIDTSSGTSPEQVEVKMMKLYDSGRAEEARWRTAENP